MCAWGSDTSRTDSGSAYVGQRASASSPGGMSVRNLLQEAALWTEGWKQVERERPPMMSLLPLLLVPRWVHTSLSLLPALLPAHLPASPRQRGLEEDRMRKQARRPGLVGGEAGFRPAPAGLQDLGSASSSSRWAVGQQGWGQGPEQSWAGPGPWKDTLEGTGCIPRNSACDEVHVENMPSLCSALSLPRLPSLGGAVCLY